MGSKPDFLNSIEIYVELNKIEKEGILSSHFPLKNCDSSFLNSTFWTKLNQIKRNGQIFCPDFRKAYNEKESKQENFVQGGFGEADSTFLSVSILSCNKNNPSCAEYKHEFGVFYATVVSFDSFTESTNYSNNVNYRLNSSVSQVTNSFYTKHYIEIDYNALKTDSGWLFTKEESETYHSLGKRTYEIADYTERARALYQFTFSAPQKSR